MTTTTRRSPPTSTPVGVLLTYGQPEAYWNIVAVPPSSATPPPSPQAAPSHGGPRPKGKGKGGKSKGGKGQRPFYQKGSASARAQSAPQCLKCGQTGHWSSECPNNSKPTSGSSSPTKKAKTTEGYVYMVEKTFNPAEPFETEDIFVTAETYVNQQAPQQVHGIMDNGASSVFGWSQHFDEPTSLSSPTPPRCDFPEVPISAGVVQRSTL